MKASLSLPLVVLGSLLSGSAVVAQSTSVATIPVGYLTVHFPATTQNTGSLLSIPLHKPPAFSGVVASVSANSVQVSGTPFTANQFAGTGNPHFLRFKSGQQEGRTMLILSNTTNSLVVDTTDNSPQTTALNLTGFQVQPSDTFDVIPGDTLASLFGDNTPENPLVFVGGSSSFSSDTFTIFKPNSNVKDIFFFSTTLGHWRSVASSLSANNVIIYPEVGLLITRRSGRPAFDLVLTGQVPSSDIKLKVVGGNTGYYTSTMFPVDMTLEDFYSPQWSSGTSLFSADTLRIWNPSLTQNNTFFRLPDGTWRKSGDPHTDQSSVVIAAGSGFSILKRASVTGSNSFLNVTIPYNLD